MAESARVRLVLWVATAVMLVAGVVAVPLVGNEPGPDVTIESAGSPADAALTPAAPTTTESEFCAANGGCGGGDGGDPSSSAPSVAPTRGGAAPVARTTGSPSATTPTTSAGAATTAPPATTAPEDLGAPQDPGPSKPPRAGLYRYKAQQGDQSSDATTTVTDKGTTPTETRQLVSLRGSGLQSDNDVAWRKDGVYLLSSDFQFGQNHGTCDWDPDMVQLRLPLAVGTSWESTGTCTVTGIGPTPIPVKRTVTGRVLELRRVRVAGQVVDVWAIDGTEHIEFAGNVIDASGTTLFSPRHGLAVRTTGKAKGSGPNGAGETPASTEIQNLDPE